MKVVVDMNLSVAWSDGLRNEGIDSAHWRTIGLQDAAGDLIIQWACQNNAIVLTRDLDFGIALRQQARTAPSVIQIRAGRVTLPVYLPRVVSVLTEHRQALEEGAFVSIDEKRVRIRHLDPDLPI